MPLTNEQYESIMKKYDATRTRNRHLLEERRLQVYRCVPEYQKLEAESGRLSVACARRLLDGEEEALQLLHEKLKDLGVQKGELLKKAGFPEDFLSPVYDCPDCQDTGYLPMKEGESGDEYSSPKKCHCFRRQEITMLYEQSNIQSMIEKENFSTLSFDYYQGEDLKRFQEAVRISLDFVQNFKQDYQNLFFYGTVGTGKSFLSGCIARELLQQGLSVIYFSASGLFDTLARYSFDVKAKETLYNFCKDLYNSDLVIIDDLGTEITNSFVTSQLFACLNKRVLGKKSTIISTNLSLEELKERYSDRIFSRITSNFTLCKLTGPDIRLYKKRRRNN